MSTKFGLTRIGLSGDLEPKNKNFHFGTEVQDGCHESFVQKYELQT